MRIDDDLAMKAYAATWHDKRDHLMARIPDYMQGGFARWVLWGIKPGDFLYAVACSDLFKAFRHADDANQAAMTSWVKLFYNAAPAGCFGSDSLAERWHKQGGLLGRCKDCGTYLDVPDHPGTARVDTGGDAICDQCAEHRADQKHAANILQR
jgi:hypothetical protein